LVQFQIDGRPAGVDYSVPFELELSVPSGVSSFELGALATDLAGNQSHAATVSVQVLPDASPSVALVSPEAGSRLAAGTSVLVAAEAADDVKVEQVEFFVDGQSRALLAAPPYRFLYTVPADRAQLTLLASATDGDGNWSDSEPLSLAVVGDQPPDVVLVEPLDGSLAVADSSLFVAAAAVDDVGVELVQLYVDGVLHEELTASPYRSDLRVPAPGSTLDIVAVAFDSAGQQSVSNGARITSIVDPLTTVHGLVLHASGHPAEGAELSVFLPGFGTFSATASTDGHFQIQDVPTSPGPFVVEAAIRSAGLLLEAGASDLVYPDPFGASDAGTIRMSGPAVLASSDFSVNAEGWRVFGDGILSYRASGGSPGGFIRITDQPQSLVSYFDAPAKFLGDKSAAYGWTLEYDVRHSSGGLFDGVPELILVGGDLTLHFNHPAPGTSWKHLRLRLEAGAAGWTFGSSTGPAPTEEQFRTVLSALTQLRIRAEYIIGADFGDLDSVVIFGSPQAP
jgi:hypothetical protein